jgi:hypothetical protein
MSLIILTIPVDSYVNDEVMSLHLDTFAIFIPVMEYYQMQLMARMHHRVRYLVGVVPIELLESFHRRDPSWIRNLAKEKDWKRSETIGSRFYGRAETAASDSYGVVRSEKPRLG